MVVQKNIRTFALRNKIINKKTLTMGKINFTRQHYDKLKSLATDMLFKNETIMTSMGQVLNITELLHTQSIGVLNNIRISLDKKLDSISKQDEWVATDAQQAKSEKLKNQRELVNLLIGYKRYTMEQNELKAQKEKLSAQLEELKESQKTPEDRIKELADAMAALQIDPDFE